MESLVSQVQQSDQHSNRPSFSASVNVASHLKAIAKRKRVESIIDRSSVKTPAVVKFMEKLWSDEGGLEMYENGEGEEEEFEVDSPTGLSTAPPVTLAQVQANSILDSWCTSFEAEKNSYDSLSVFAEVRLKEALAATEEVRALESCYDKLVSTD